MRFFYLIFFWISIVSATEVHAIGLKSAQVDVGLVVKTQFGEVRGSAGERDKSSVNFFGVPYAAPPIGENRFRAPQPAQKWEGVRDASTADLTPTCAQILNANPFRYSGIEDCLYLNIFTHQGIYSPKTVVVKIHGGGMVVGTSPKDAEAEAKNSDTVVVTMNYRLNIFGSFAMPELAREDLHGSSGNNSIRDVIAALRWVKRNIRRFGGNPNDIMIAGGSAGGTLVSYLMASPLTRGLFHRAFAFSPVLASNFLPTLDQPSAFLESAYVRGEETIVAAGCGSANDRLQCMREIDPQILAIAGLERKHLLINVDTIQETWPIIDGYVLRRQPAESVLSGINRNVPFVLGSTEDDGLFLNRQVSSEEEYFQELETLFFFGLSNGKITRKQVDSVWERYDPDWFDGQFREASNALVSDLLFNCTGFAFAENVAASRARRAPAYHYQFTHPLKNRLGSRIPLFHLIDRAFWFEGLVILRLFFGAVIGEEEREMSQIMSGVYQDFVQGKMPDPNFWPPLSPFDPMAKDHIELENGLDSRVVSTIRNGRCEFLRDIGLLSPLPVKRWGRLSRGSARFRK